MALKSNGLNNKFRTTLDLQLENKLSLVDGWINNPISYSLNGFTLTLNYSKFILNGIIFEETGGVSFVVDEPEEEDRVDIIVIKENIDTFSPINSTDTFNTIKSVEYVYKKGTQAVGSNESLFIKIEIPVTATSLQDCTITTLNKTTTAKEILNKINEVELEIENHEMRITELETNPIETHTHENKEVLDNVTQEQLDQIEINKTNIQNHETRITQLETNGGGGETHEHPNLAVLNKLRQKDLDQIRFNADNILKNTINLSKEILYRKVADDAILMTSSAPTSEFSDLFINTLEDIPYIENLNGAKFYETHSGVGPNKYVELYNNSLHIPEENYKLFHDYFATGKIYAITNSKNVYKVDLNMGTVELEIANTSNIDNSTDTNFIGDYIGGKYYYIPCELGEFRIYKYDTLLRTWFDETPASTPVFNVPSDTLCFIDSRYYLNLIFVSGENKGKHIAYDAVQNKFISDFKTFEDFDSLETGSFLYTVVPRFNRLYILNNYMLYEITGYDQYRKNLTMYKKEVSFWQDLSESVLFLDTENWILKVAFGYLSRDPFEPILDSQILEININSGRTDIKDIQNYPQDFLSGSNKQALYVLDENWDISRVYFYKLNSIDPDAIYMIDIKYGEFIQQQQWSFESQALNTTEVLNNVYAYIQYVANYKDPSAGLIGIQFSRDGGMTWSNIVNPEQLIDISTLPVGTQLKLRFLCTGDLLVTAYAFGGGNNLLFE